MANEIVIPKEGFGSIIPLVKYEAFAPNLGDRVRAAIIIPAEASKPVYGDIVLEMCVYSTRRPQSLFRGLFNLHGMQPGRARTKAGILAGALAEKVCETHLDVLDTNEYARQGARAFDMAVRRFELQERTLMPEEKGLEHILNGLRARGIVR